MDEHGAFPAVLGMAAIIIFVGLGWTVMNEVVLRTSEWANTMPADRYGWALPAMLYIWRIAPLMLLIAGIVWAILQAHKGQVVE